MSNNYTDTDGRGRSQRLQQAVIYRNRHTGQLHCTVKSQDGCLYWSMTPFGFACVPWGTSEEHWQVVGYWAWLIACMLCWWRAEQIAHFTKIRNDTSLWAALAAPFMGM